MTIDYNEFRARAVTNQKIQNEKEWSRAADKLMNDFRAECEKSDKRLSNLSKNVLNVLWKKTNQHTKHEYCQFEDLHETYLSLMELVFCSMPLTLFLPQS
jgi:hypothetical protein